jgi:hypothetical protein
MTSAINPLNKPRRGASLLLEILESEGVKYFFGIPGTTELTLGPSPGWRPGCPCSNLNQSRCQNRSSQSCREEGKWIDAIS